MKVVVAGSRGMLAQDLIPLLERDHETLCFDENQLDITDKDRVIDLMAEVKPDLIVNCAAYNMVDQAENEREAAFLVNASGVQHLALACQQFDIRLCHFSTDYVFDGAGARPYRPEDRPSPLNAYGESKYAGEVFVQSMLDRYYIIRTSSLYGKGGTNFVHTVLRLAKEGEVLRIVEDQIMSPTWTVNLARGSVDLISSGRFGLYHLTDQTEKGISWFEFAVEILKIAGRTNEVRPVTSADFPRPARRPQYSVLDTGLFTSRTGYEPLPWRESLRRFLGKA